MRLGHGLLGGLGRGGLSHADAGDLADLDTQAPELQGVEEPVDGRHVGRAAGQVGGGDLEIHVGQEAIEAAVTHDVVHVLAQGSAALSTDLVGARQQVVQAVVLVDPLCGRLGPHAGHSRQIIRRLADDRGDLRVAMRRHPVLGFDGLGRHTAQVARSRARAQDGDAVGHRLEGVAVTRHDENGRSLLAGTVSERRQNIVSLETFARQRDNTHRVQDLADELHLALEFLGGRLARALVLRVLLGTK